MNDNNFFRASIYHCIETDGNIEPIYIPDGLMVVNKESGRIVDIGRYSDPVSYTHLTLPTKA